MHRDFYKHLTSPTTAHYTRTVSNCASLHKAIHKIHTIRKLHEDVRIIMSTITVS